MKKKKTVRKRAKRLLSTREPKPFHIENAKGKGAGLILCDHASHQVPAALKDLGLSKKDLKKHIGWDIGAADVARQLARALDMPLVQACYSRLVVDLNRAPGHRECMAEVSDDIKVPGNQDLTKAERQQRLKEIFKPYQSQIGKQVQRLTRGGRIPLLISVHSFTPAMGGRKRPWHISLLWHREEKIARKIVREIRKNNPGLLVGENEPYSLFDERFKGSTMDVHAEAHNLPYVFVEFRQDLVDTKQKAARWAEIFLQALRRVLEDPETYQGRKDKKPKR